MSALDKITEEILKQANAQADDILRQAEETAAGILEKGQTDRKEWAQRLKETTEQECREIAKRAESTDRQNRRRALLEVRNQVIDEVISEAKTKLTDGVDTERFKVTEQGNILLNNTIDAIFEAEMQTLRDKAYEVLMAEE